MKLCEGIGQPTLITRNFWTPCGGYLGRTWNAATCPVCGQQAKVRDNGEMAPHGVLGAV